MNEVTIKDSWNEVFVKPRGWVFWLTKQAAKNNRMVNRLKEAGIRNEIR